MKVWIVTAKVYLPGGNSVATVNCGVYSTREKAYDKVAAVRECPERWACVKRDSLLDVHVYMYDVE